MTCPRCGGRCVLPGWDGPECALCGWQGEQVRPTDVRAREEIAAIRAEPYVGPGRPRKDESRALTRPAAFGERWQQTVRTVVAAPIPAPLRGTPRLRGHVAADPERTIRSAQDHAKCKAERANPTYAARCLELAALWDQGAAVTEIARQTGLHHGVVRRMLRDHERAESNRCAS